MGMVLASRVCGCLFGNPIPQKNTPWTPKFFVDFFLFCQSQAHIWCFSSPYFSNNFVYGYHVVFGYFYSCYGWKVCILQSPLNFWTPNIITITNFRLPVSMSWLRPCYGCLFFSSASFKRTPQVTHMFFCGLSKNIY